MTRYSPRQAKSLDVMLAEVNMHAPKRDKASDGGKGDDKHKAAKSDHNVNDQGVWRARDVDNDPDGGMSGFTLSRKFAAMLGKHPALGSGAYVIFNGEIISTDRIKEGWRKYTGLNAHRSHVHISVGRRGYDSTAPWNLFPKSRPVLTKYQRARALAADAEALARDHEGDRPQVDKYADALRTVRTNPAFPSN